MRFNKIYYFVTFLILAINANAQHVGNFFNKYYNEYLSVDIHVSDISSKKDAVFIDCQFLNSKVGFMVVPVKSLDDFVKSLKKLKEKSLEWATIANDKGVYEMRKKIPIKFPRVEFIWFEDGDKDKSRSTVLDDDDSILKFEFILGESGWFTTGSAFAFDYKDRGSDGFIFVFSSEDDFNEFINVLDVKKIKELVKTKRKEKDLFK